MSKVSSAAKKRVKASPASSGSREKYTLPRMQFRGAKIKLTEARKAFRALHAQSA